MVHSSFTYCWAFFVAANFPFETRKLRSVKYFFFFFLNACLIFRQHFPTQCLLAAEICSWGLHSALYFSLLFISGCFFFQCLFRWRMILIVILFDDLYVACQHLVCFDVWWHHGLYVHLCMCHWSPLSNLWWLIFFLSFLCVCFFLLFVFPLHLC